MNPKAMFNISYGLYVLTANLDGKDNGCIINTVTQVTSAPTQITIAVNKSNYTRDMIAASKKFTASIISFLILSLNSSILKLFNLLIF